MSQSEDIDPVTAFRRLAATEQEAAGQKSLREHLRAQAEAARHRYSPFDATRLQAFLGDTDCLRHPVRLVYELGEMAAHQFAQPDIDWRSPESGGRVIYLRPELKDRPELLPLAIAYVVPVINFGDIIGDEHCLLYGAALLGLSEEDYYRRLCTLADAVGASSQSAETDPSQRDADGGCGSGGCGGRS